MPRERSDDRKVLARNRKAFHEYDILERVEAGLALTGTEIKSIRAGGISIEQAYVRPRGQELFLVGAHIDEYKQGNRYNHDPTRFRKLLLHRKELDRLVAALSQKGCTLIPLDVHLRHGYAKLEVGLGRGRRAYDKRELIKKREAEREIARSRRYEGRR